MVGGWFGGVERLSRGTPGVISGGRGGLGGELVEVVEAFGECCGVVEVEE